MHMYKNMILMITIGMLSMAMRARLTPEELASKEFFDLVKDPYVVPADLIEKVKLIMKDEFRLDLNYNSLSQALVDYASLWPVTIANFDPVKFQSQIENKVKEKLTSFIKKSAKINKTNKSVRLELLKSLVDKLTQDCTTLMKFKIRNQQLLDQEGYKPVVCNDLVSDQINPKRLELIDSYEAGIINAFVDFDNQLVNNFNYNHIKSALTFGESYHDAVKVTISILRDEQTTSAETYRIAGEKLFAFYIFLRKNQIKTLNEENRQTLLMLFWNMLDFVKLQNTDIQEIYIRNFNDVRKLNGSKTDYLNFVNNIFYSVYNNGVLDIVDSDVENYVSQYVRYTLNHKINTDTIDNYMMIINSYVTDKDFQDYALKELLNLFHKTKNINVLPFSRSFNIYLDTTSMDNNIYFNVLKFINGRIAVGYPLDEWREIKFIQNTDKHIDKLKTYFENFTENFTNTLHRAAQNANIEIKAEDVYTILTYETFDRTWFKGINALEIITKQSSTTLELNSVAYNKQGGFNTIQRKNELNESMIDVNEGEEGLNETGGFADIGDEARKLHQSIPELSIKDESDLHRPKIDIMSIIGDNGDKGNKIHVDNVNEKNLVIGILPRLPFDEYEKLVKVIANPDFRSDVLAGDIVEGFDKVVLIDVLTDECLKKIRKLAKERMIQ